MSLTSWKPEFYPIEAKRVKPKKALAHSLQKWEGLLPNNLKKHQIRLQNTISLCLVDDNIDPDTATYKEGILYIDAKTCALCYHYYDSGCEQCPLAQYLGRRCDNDGPYTEAFHGDVKPMVHALRNAMKHSQEK